MIRRGEAGKAEADGLGKGVTVNAGAGATDEDKAIGKRIRDNAARRAKEYDDLAKKAQGAKDKAKNDPEGAQADLNKIAKAMDELDKRYGARKRLRARGIPAKEIDDRLVEAVGLAIASGNGGSPNDEWYRRAAGDLLKKAGINETEPNYQKMLDETVEDLKDLYLAEGRK